MDYEDILYEEKNGVATITINRPKVYNAFRPRTCVELDRRIPESGLGGNGRGCIDRGGQQAATGGDVGHDGAYGDGETRRHAVEELHTVIATC